LRCRYPSVFNRRVSPYFITVQCYFSDLLFDKDSDGLLLRLGFSRVTDDVVLEHQIVCLSPNTDTSGFTAYAVVLDDIFLQTVAMGRHPQGFISEKDAVLAVRSYNIPAKKIVGIFVPDGNSELPVLFENVVGKQPVPYPPAQKQAVGPIAAGNTIAHARTLGAASRVYAKVAVTLTNTTGDRNIIGLLETDPVAVVVSDHAVLNHRPEGLI